MGWIDGGYQALVDAPRRDASARAAARCCTDTPVSAIVPSADGRAIGVVARRPASAPHDQVVTTLLRPHLRTLLAARARGRAAAPTAAATSASSAS